MEDEVGKFPVSFQRIYSNSRYVPQGFSLDGIGIEDGFENVMTLYFDNGA